MDRPHFILLCTSVLSSCCQHLLQVEMAERYERRWAGHACASLCVSAAMQKELRQGWGVRAALCYDRPPLHFQPTPLPEAHQLLQASCAAVARQRRVCTVCVSMRA